MSDKHPSYKTKGDLTKGSVRGHLVRLTLPMIWGLFAVIFVQLVDTYFISLLGDTDILAGISFTFPVTMLISHLVFGFNIALASVVSRLIGEGRDEDMRRIVLHGILMGFATTVVIAWLTYLHLEQIFTALGADEKTYPTVAAYMPLWLIAVCMLAFPTKANSAVRAGGDTVIPALVMTVVALVNLILDPLLIFGLYGFPEMGVKGAAFATLIAFTCGAVLAIYIVAFRKKMIAIDGLHLDELKDSAKRILVIAIPAGIANVIVPFSMAVITAILASYGPEAVAAFGIVGRVEALAMLVVMALSISLAPIIGQNWGAKKYERVREAITLAIGFNLMWSAFVAVILALGGYGLAGMFTQDPAVIRYTVLFFMIIPVTYGVGNIVYGWSSAFNAMGKPRRAFVIIAVRALVVGIPAAYIAGYLYGVEGIIVSIALSNLLTGAAFHVISTRHCRACEGDRGEGAA